MQKYRFAIATGENHLIRVDKRIKFIVYTSLCRVSSANYASHRRQLAWIVLGRVYRSAAVQLQRMQQANRIDVCANFLLFGLKTRRASTLAREREGRIITSTFSAPFFSRRPRIFHYIIRFALASLTFGRYYTISVIRHVRFRRFG